MGYKHYTLVDYLAMHLQCLVFSITIKFYSMCKTKQEWVCTAIAVFCLILSLTFFPRCSWSLEKLPEFPWLLCVSQVKRILSCSNQWIHVDSIWTVCPVFFILWRLRADPISSFWDIRCISLFLFFMPQYIVMIAWFRNNLHNILDFCT